MFSEEKLGTVTLGLILDEKIKENELAQGLGVGKQPCLPEPHTEGRAMGTKRRIEKEK